MRWVLTRAFAPPGAPAPALEDPYLIFPLAQELNLDARIGARIPNTLLEAELGPEVAHRFLLASFVCEARNHQLLNHIRTLADLAQSLGVRFCLLKGSALVVLGIARGRWVSDCDVLATPQDAQRLFQALVTQGWVPEPAPPPSHHLPHLTGPGGAVELHTALPALRQDLRGPWADFDSLAKHGLLAPAEAAFPPAVLIPQRQVLAAHAVVHALRQHRFAPEAYPPFRLLADLADLGVDQPTLNAFLQATGFSLQLPPDEVNAVIRLAGALTAGDLAQCDLKGRRSPEGILLAHFIAGALQPDYAQSLKLRATLARPTNQHPTADRLRALFRAVWLTDRQVELIYGVQKTRWRVWAWRLFRPFDLLARSLRAFYAAQRISKKRKSPTASQTPSGLTSDAGV